MASAGPNKTRPKRRTFHPPDRMLQILELLYAVRYMRTDQIQRIFFRQSKGGTSGLKKSCQRTMRRLYQHGYVRRIEQPVKWHEPRKHYIYTLAEKGAEAIAARLAVTPTPSDWRPKSHEEHWPFMDHLLATVELRIAFTLACEAAGAAIVWWRDERELHTTLTEPIVFTTGDKEHKARLIPDAAFLLAYKGEYSLFLVEVDRGTVTISPSLMERRGFIRKVLVSKAFADSGVCARHFGTHSPTFLTITTSPLRLHHLQKAAQQVDAGERFLFATFVDAMVPEKLLTDCIWRPAQHQEPPAQAPDGSTPGAAAADPMALLPCTGTVTWYDPHTDGSCGIIRPDVGADGVIVYKSHLTKPDGLRQGDPVRFVRRGGEKGDWADLITRS